MQQWAHIYIYSSRYSPIRVEAVVVSLSLLHSSFFSLSQQVAFFQRLQALVELQECLEVVSIGPLAAENFLFNQLGNMDCKVPPSSVLQP